MVIIFDFLLSLSRNFYEKSTNPAKMDVQFDEHGLITPKEIIALSLADFERIFVKERKEKKYRQQIFDEYLRHNDQIQREVGPILFQFVNGLFLVLLAAVRFDFLSSLSHIWYSFQQEPLLFLY